MTGNPRFLVKVQLLTNNAGLSGQLICVRLAKWVFEGPKALEGKVIGMIETKPCLNFCRDSGMQ